MNKLVSILKWILIIAFLCAAWFVTLYRHQGCDLFLTLGFVDKCPEKSQVDDKSI
jgi:hypothetical protein